MTDKAEIERAMADAIAELIKHGGSERDVEALRRQFKALATDEDAKPTDNKFRTEFKGQPYQRYVLVMHTKTKCF